MPFVHSHKDNKEFEISEDDVFKISPNGQRCIKASKESSIGFICIQVKINSLDAFTETDRVILENKPSWL